ncbi:MAG: Ppx/GppA phosphatase family protein [Pseudomonadota bacterium]
MDGAEISSDATASATGNGRDGASACKARGPIAALDLGTNNCRLLIAQPQGEDFRVIDAFSRPVRLGEGMEQHRVLSRVAQDRAIKALRICAGKLRQHRVAGCRLIATEACRRAENGRSFARRVRRETGLTLRIVSAEEEARFAVAGCAPLVDPEAEQLLVIDIGGGSTELIWVDLSATTAAKRRALVKALAPLLPGDDCENCRAAETHVSDWRSVPFGVSTLHDRFAGITDDRARYDAMAASFAEALAGFRPLETCDRAGQCRKLQIIGVSGTATTFGALHLGLRVYDRTKVDGLWLDCSDARAVTERLLGLGTGGRARCPGIGRNRSELVISGAAILSTVLDTWPTRRLRIADRGLCEGMLYGLLHHQKLIAG